MTSTPIRLGIVGLGGMGRVLFNAALPHPDFVVTRAADLDPDTIARLRADHPDVAFSTEPSDVIGADAVDAVYIATPPGTHASFAVPALEAGQAVFCEKPLAVSAADGDAMVSAARASGRAGAVNFSLSDRQSTRYVEAAIGDGRVGEVLGVEVRFAFPVWPREFQAVATWVGERAQGGFVREVFSHFAYLTDRLVGPLELVHGVLDHRGAGSETAAYGLMRAGGVPVYLSGVVGAGRGLVSGYCVGRGSPIVCATGATCSLQRATGGRRSSSPANSVRKLPGCPCSPARSAGRRRPTWRTSRPLTASNRWSRPSTTTSRPGRYPVR